MENKKNKTLENITGHVSGVLYEISIQFLKALEDSKTRAAIINVEDLSFQQLVRTSHILEVLYFFEKTLKAEIKENKSRLPSDFYSVVNAAKKEIKNFNAFRKKQEN